MTPKQVIDFFGNQPKAAKALGVSKALVSHWKIKGKIFYFRQLDIEKKTGGKLKAAA